MQALTRIKKSVDEGADPNLEKAVRHEAKYFTEIFKTEDAKEGVYAFIEKRAPQFKHK